DRAVSRPGHSEVFPRRFRLCPAEAAAAVGEGGLPLRGPAQGEYGAGAEDCPPPQAPGGRPSHKPKVFYASFRYQAKSWECARRVVAKAECHAGELFPRVGFLVTNLKGRSKRVVRFYNGRGTAKQWIKEGKNAVKWTKLSCRRFKDIAARRHVFALAYNL